MRTALVTLASGFLVATSAFGQTISRLPSTGASGETAEFVVEHLEAPAEIALGTMAVNVWARLALSGGDPISGATIVVGPEGERVEMRAVDGAFDSSAEEVVATIDTFTWREEERRTFELRARAARVPPVTVAEGSIRMKTRIASPDLFVLDQRGVGGAWIGSGAGGFTASDPVDAGFSFEAPSLADVNRDGLLDVVLPDERGDVRVYRNRGGGRFEMERAIVAGTDLVQAILGDLDADGTPDLVTVSGNRALEIRLGLDDVPIQSTPLTLVPDRVGLADLDGDGRPEIYLALLGFSDSEIQVWTDGGDAVWRPTGRLAPGPGGRERVRAFLRVGAGGKSPERLFVLADAAGEGMLESWSGAADTTAESEPALRSNVRIPGEPLLVTWGRFLADGRESWVVLAHEEGRAVIHGADADGSVRRLGELSPVPAGFAVLDVDSDGDDDLVTGGDDLRVWINVEGRLREAGESPYFLEAPVTALVSGSLDERSP